MPELVSTVITTAQARARDPLGAVHTTSLCLDLLTRLQWLYNNHLQLVTQEVTFTPDGQRILYPLSTLTNGQGITILEVLHQSRHLDQITLPQLRAIDPRWPRSIGHRPEIFIQLGFTHAIIWPAVSRPEPLTIISTLLTQDLRAGGTLLDIPLHVTPKLTQLLELLLLLRDRDMMSFEALWAELHPKQG